MLTWTSPARGRSKPSARTPAKPPPLSRTTAAIARATSTSSVRRFDVERDQRPAGADQHGARGGVQPQRPEVGDDLAGVDPRLEPRGAAAAEECRAATGTAVEEYRQPELADRAATSRAAARARSMSSGLIGTSGTTSAAPTRGCAPSCRRRSIRSRARPTPATSASDQLRLRTDQREHRAVVVRVGVHVEQAGARARQCRADRLDRSAVSSLGEVRHRLERQHVTYPRPR